MHHQPAAATAYARKAVNPLKRTHNEAIVDSRLRPRCATHDEYLLIFIIEQNFVKFLSRLLCLPSSVAAEEYAI